MSKPTNIHKSWVTNVAPWVFNSISLLLALAVAWCYFSKQFNYLGTEFHLSPLSLKKKKKKKKKKLNSEQYLATSTIPNYCLFCKKKHTFSILHTHFYKTSILVYLFYHLFYLNNNISLIFFIISNKPISTWAHLPFSFFVVRRR